MANFKLNPARWVPLGQQIIDGGPSRLLRMFYNAVIAPTARHGNYCVAILDPAPPQEDEFFWRDIVRDFIVNHHQREVNSMQPGLFGVGLYELCSHATVTALVEQEPFEIDDNVFVSFVHHNDHPNHRAANGFRIGWLMVLSVLLDYRNDYDIFNAVAAFGKFHHWHQDDAFIERTMIYASYQSPALVPRDIVFGNYSNLGDAHESWTAPVYVLDTPNAGMLPTDEDQMPPDGNPHPLPGNLIVNNNMWVLPQYPVLVWNNVPLHGPQQQNNQQQGEQMEEMHENMVDEPVEEVVQDSIALYPSAAQSTANDLHADQEVNQQYNTM